MSRSLAKTLVGSIRSDAEASLGTAGRIIRPSPSGPLELRVEEGRGLVLLSYLREAAGLGAGDPALTAGHPNKWDSWCIAQTLVGLGWNVDVIDWNDRGFRPVHDYALIVAIDGNAARLERLSPGKTPELVMHLTTAYPRFHNAAERERITGLRQRRDINLRPRRQLTNLAAFDESLAKMSNATLIGNSWTLSTYPDSIRRKTVLVDVTTTATVSALAATTPAEREGAVWFGGGGAVHKGLDLALEAVARDSSINLDVIGGLEAERDFFMAYRRELFKTSRISYHGYIQAGSSELDQILLGREFIIAPSCSEGMSNALAYCLLKGLIPVYTKSSGIDVPDGIGLMIDEPRAENITASIRKLSSLPHADRKAMSSAASAFAEEAFSRDRYASSMRSFFRRVTTSL